jgi:MFS family permease
MSWIWTEHHHNRANAAYARDARHYSHAATIIASIVVLLIYQGYSLSIIGIASPWIAKSFVLDQAQLAELFAWMSVSAFGTFILARLADRVGRRPIILSSLVFAPLCAVGAAISRHPASFALFEILISALLGGAVSSAIVLLAEELPVEQRARGQAFAACASAVGGALGYIVIPFLLQWEYSWRWLLAPCIAGIALVVPIGRTLPIDSQSVWFASTASVSRSRFFDIFHPLYRRRATTLLVCAALDTIAGSAVNGWLYFEAVSISGLSPQKASLVVVAGMILGMFGFPAGAWTSEHFGRVPTVMYVGGAAWLGALAFYWGPPNSVAWPLAAYCWFKLTSGVMTVGANSAATELLPTALRSTMIGWQGITAAAFSMLAQVLIAALIGPLGGLTIVIRYLALLGIPSAVIFGAFIDETRGLALGVAAKEDEWAAVKNFHRAPEKSGNGPESSDRAGTSSDAS